jgi:hypothetical protein
MTMNATRSVLLSTVSRLEGPQIAADHGADRFAIAKRVLGRTPVVLIHPMPPHQVVWVESEPDDWRAFIEQANADGGLQPVLRAAGRMH